MSSSSSSPSSSTWNCSTIKLPLTHKSWGWGWKKEEEDEVKDDERRVREKMKRGRCSTFNQSTIKNKAALHSIFLTTILDVIIIQSSIYLLLPIPQIHSSSCLCWQVCWSGGISGFVFKKIHIWEGKFSYFFFSSISVHGVHLKPLPHFVHFLLFTITSLAHHTFFRQTMSICQIWPNKSDIRKFVVLIDQTVLHDSKVC